MSISSIVWIFGTHVIYIRVLPEMVSEFLVLVKILDERTKDNPAEKFGRLNKLYSSGSTSVRLTRSSIVGNGKRSYQFTEPQLQLN